MTSGDANRKATLSLEERTDGVVVIWMDDPDEPVNMLKRRLIDEFDRRLEAVGKN